MEYINIHSHSKKNNDGIVIFNAMNINDIPRAEDNFYISTALHPWYLKPELWMNPLNDYEEEIAKDEIIAIGECGIDFSVKIKTKLQKTIFAKHLIWAEKYNKPLIIHCVKAFNEIIAMKKKANLKQVCIIHGFNNNINIARQLLNAGFFLSFGEELTYDDSNAKQIIKITPLDKLFLETDESELSIREIYAKAAEILEIEIDKLKNQISDNFKKVFNKE